MLQMRNESGAHFDQQGPELRISGAGEQGLVHCIQNGLVIGHFMINVGLVECLATQAFEPCKILIAALLKTLTSGVALGSDVQFLHQLGCGLIDSAVVFYHEVGEPFDLS
jgi:hypothetical protein